MSRGDVTTTRDHVMRTDYDMGLPGRVAGLLCLAIRSGFCPGPLGYGLVTAAAVYVVDSYTRLMAVEYHAHVELGYWR